MPNLRYRTPKDVLRRAQEAVGKTFREIDSTGRIMSGKGAIGQVIEESWFGYKPNGTPGPDFEEAGVELKVTPYVRTNKGCLRAKERLVCNIIDYMHEYKKTFLESDFWHKCNQMLIMSYQHLEAIDKADFSIDKAFLFGFPEEDLCIVKADWENIIDRIKHGEAHLITEGQTLYLAGCTKGANRQSVRPQPFSRILAMQRAYSLKSSYMTQILRTYVFGANDDEHIIKDWHELEEQTFEEAILRRVEPFLGKTDIELKWRFGVSSTAKDLHAILLAKMLGVDGRVSATDEFQNASVVPKTIRIAKNGHIRENMSFPAFRFLDLVHETWETSTFRNYLEPTKFLFVIFREETEGEYVFEKVMFWNIPAEDLEEVRRVWERTVKIVREGVRLWRVGGNTHNNLPKQSESRISHVRPHARDQNDTYPLPDGRSMPKQCFWLNREYIESIVLAKDEKTNYVPLRNDVGALAARPIRTYHP